MYNALRRAAAPAAGRNLRSIHPHDESDEEHLRGHIDRLPGPLGRAIHWLRRPGARAWRIPAAGLLTLGGLLWFLPVVGLWMLPLGLLLLGEEVPPLKRWLLRLSRRWRRR